MSAASGQGRTAGIAMMCVGVACMSVNDALAKSLAAGYSPVQILFLRSLIALPFAVLIALRMGGRGALRSYRPGAHLARGLVWIGATLLFFTSIGLMGLAEATALLFCAPLFVTALSALVLGEPVGWRRWAAVLAGFAGVLIVIRPGTDAFQMVSLLPVGAAFLYALMMLGARWVDPRESVWTLGLYLTGAGAVLSVVIVPFVWRPVPAGELWLFVLIALFGAAGMTMITQAFRFAPAAVVAPLDYTGLIWAVLLGWLIWSETPDAATLTGATIIVASGIVTIVRGRRA